MATCPRPHTQWTRQVWTLYYFCSWYFGPSLHLSQALCQFQNKWQLLSYLTRCGPVILYDFLELRNIGSGNGLLSDGTNSLSEPMLTYHQRCSMALTWEQFHKKFSWTQPATCVLRLPSSNDYRITKGPWVKVIITMKNGKACFPVTTRKSVTQR